MSAPVRNPARPPSPEVVALPLPVDPAEGLLTVVMWSLSSGTLVCAVSGEVDVCTAPWLRDRLLPRIHLAGPDLVVDLAEVRFFGAAGLTVLVEAKAAADASGVGFCVVARTRPVLLPLALTGLDLEFDVHPHIDGVPTRGGVPGQRPSLVAVSLVDRHSQVTAAAEVSRPGRGGSPTRTPGAGAPRPRPTLAASSADLPASA
ncbi:anti-anti-sigma factor [Saccharothrix ecbatanensis]|uniref:Anti-anti-sigma factor n=1 Tax=Saccharothrix ecbatanensis TaxID=1105145 RepID=A0A7W9M166_9PSEU|nr:anti-anti-sigma factor [Saccharothrix ecbatanensis]